MRENDRYIPVAEPCIGSREQELVTDCIKSGWVSSLGVYITRFEEDFARFCGVKHGVATSNGTTALHLALATLGIGPGDEVIVPTLTFIATANAVTYTGATAVFADSEPDTWNLDPDDVEKRITPRTKAIIGVHLYGHPVDMAALKRVASEHGLWLIEDAAEAHGATCDGKRVGSIGDIGIFSFYGNKIITTGEGGMLVTENEDWAERAAWLRDHGMSRARRYWHPVIGYNYRMTNVQAAIGVAQMERIDEFISAKRRHVDLYNHLLGNIPELTLPPEEPWATNVYWMYSVLIDRGLTAHRDDLMAGLKERRIDSRPFFYPIHTMPPYLAAEKFPVAEDLAPRGLNLPSAVNLTDDDIYRICEEFREVLGQVVVKSHFRSTQPQGQIAS